VRRALLERLPIPDPPELYRGQNLLHGTALAGGNHVIWRQPLARASHAMPPPSRVLARYFTLGRDSVFVARHARAGRARLAVMAPDTSTGRLGRIAGRIRQIAAREPLSLLSLPFALPIIAVFAIAYFAGRRSAGTEITET
jgi:hypothetical protein